jgi:hypothetical protein
LHKKARIKNVGQVLSNIFENPPKAENPGEIFKKCRLQNQSVKSTQIACKHFLYDAQGYWLFFSET